MTLTRRTSRFSAGPSAGHVSIRAMFGRAAAAIECSSGVRRLHGRGDHAHPRAARQLSQTLQRLEMRLRQEREHGDPQTLQAALDLRKMAEAGHRRGPVARSSLPPHGGRQVLEQHLGHTDRQLSLELACEEIELRRAALDEEHFGGRPESGDPEAGQAQDARRHLVGRQAERRRADHRVLQETLAVGQGRARRRRRGHEDALAAPRLHVAAPFQILDRARHGVRIDAEETGELPDAGQRLIPRNAARLDDMLELLRQLPADRDRAPGIDAQADGETINCIATIVQ